MCELKEQELIQLCYILEPAYVRPESAYQAINRLKRIVDKGHQYGEL